MPHRMAAAASAWSCRTGRRVRANWTSQVQAVLSSGCACSGKYVVQETTRIFDPEGRRTITPGESELGMQISHRACMEYLCMLGLWGRHLGQLPWN